MKLIDEWVRKCPKCSGVVLGPELDSGILATEEEFAEWNCQSPSCQYSSDYVGGESYFEINTLAKESERKQFYKRVKTDNYNSFIDWCKSTILD